MKVEGDYIFNGTQDAVWEVVRDPEALAAALPGAQSFDQVGENEYEGVMDVRVGPVSGVFSGRVIISDEQPPETLILTVEGRGKPGFIKGSGHVKLTDQGDGTTLMNYEGDMQIGGRLASVGQRMLDTANKSMIRQGLESLDMLLQARAAAELEGQEVEYEPPSEAEFARVMARDVAQEMFSSSWVILISAAVAVIVLITLIVKLSRKEKDS